MLPKNWKDRTTRCPICGGKACAWGERLSFFERKRNCKACGEGCFTPVWIYPIIIAVSLLCVILGYPVYMRTNLWRTRGSLAFFIGLSGYLLSGWCMMWLVPLKPCPEKGRAFLGTARITRVLNYSVEDVYAALSNALRRSDSYKVFQRNPEDHTISVYRKGHSTGIRGFERYSPTLSAALLLEPRPDGRCGVVIAAEYPERRQISDEEKSMELEAICQLAETELEVFQYKKVAP